MPTFTIKHRWQDLALWSGEAENFRAAVLAAVASDANLSGANLSEANLSGANLSEANLSGANLSGADLSGANLSGANLSGADLIGADLSGANLSGANLSDADLSGANLSGADLSGANLSRADLDPIRRDFFAVLTAGRANGEVEFLREALCSGKVDGSQYEGACACLVGTLAHARHCRYDAIPGLTPNADRPAERFFLAIQRGDTPKNSQFAALAVQWVDEYLASEATSPATGA